MFVCSLAAAATFLRYLLSPTALKGPWSCGQICWDHGPGARIGGEMMAEQPKAEGAKGIQVAKVRQLCGILQTSHNR
jgi:hypothetical protein